MKGIVRDLDINHAQVAPSWTGTGTMNLNLHWGRTLQNKAVQLRHRSQYNYSSNYNYINYTDYRPDNPSALYPWKTNYTGSGGSGNGSILHAENQFLKKSKILTDLIDNTGEYPSYYDNLKANEKTT